MPAPRIGISLAPSRHLRIEDVVRIAQRAEDSGYESIWIPETWGTDAVTVLALLARETSSLRLGSGVFNVYSRSPAVLAQTAATLQTLSAGRFRLGLGASGPAVVEGWHGTPFARPIERLREVIGIVRLALSGRRVDWNGRVFRLQGFTLANPPDTPVPLYVAALGHRAMRLAGELADGSLPIFAPRGQVGDLLGDLWKGTAVAGRPAGEVDIAAYMPVVLGPRAESLLRQQLAYYVGGMGAFYAAFLRRQGFGPDVDRVRALWQAGERLRAVQAVSDDLLAACTLGTTPEEARHRLADYREEGIDLPILAIPHGATWQEADATVQGLVHAG